MVGALRRLVGADGGVFLFVSFFNALIDKLAHFFSFFIPLFLFKLLELKPYLHANHESWTPFRN